MTKQTSWDNVSQFESTTETFRRLNQETQKEGDRWFQENRKINFLFVLLQAKLAFFKTYFLKGSIVKGYLGFMQAVNGSLYDLLSYAKYWELTERKRGKM